MRTESKERGTKAISAYHRSRRTAARKPRHIGDDAINQVVARTERAEAQALLQPTEELVYGAGEITTRPQGVPERCDPTHVALIDTLKEGPDTIAISASEERMRALADLDLLNAGLDAARTINARNSFERMLAHQMTAAHHRALKILARVDAPQLEPADVAKFANAAAKLMTASQTAVLTLQKLRMGGEQRVVVQHVQVADGGQAVVAGQVNPANRAVLKEEGEQDGGIVP